MELLNDVVAEAATAEIGQADGTSLRIVQQGVVEIVVGILIDDEEALAFVLRTFLVIAQFAFLNLDAILLGQVTECTRIVKLLMLHDEADGIATLSTGEALAETLGGRYIE